MNHLSMTSSQRLTRPWGGGQPALLEGIACLLTLFTWTGIAFAQEANTALEEVNVTATLKRVARGVFEATTIIIDRFPFYHFRRTRKLHDNVRGPEELRCHVTIISSKSTRTANAHGSGPLGPEKLRLRDTLGTQ